MGLVTLGVGAQVANPPNRLYQTPNGTQGVGIPGQSMFQGGSFWTKRAEAHGPLDSS